MSKMITVKKAKATLQKLRQLTPANPKVADDLEMTVKETVFFMAPDLIKMSKRGFTSKELAEGLAGEGVMVKPGTLNRYLNEYAERNLEKPNTNPGGGEVKTGSENPKSTSKNLKPDDQAAAKKADPLLEVQPRQSLADNRE